MHQLCHGASINTHHCVCDYDMCFCVHVMCARDVCISAMPLNLNCRSSLALFILSWPSLSTTAFPPPYATPKTAAAAAGQRAGGREAGGARRGTGKGGGGAVLAAAAGKGGK